MNKDIIPFFMLGLQEAAEFIELIKKKKLTEAEKQRKKKIDALYLKKAEKKRERRKLKKLPP